MNTPLVIVTGASRGLGLAMASQLAAEGHRLLTLSRRRSDALPAAVEQWTMDLTEPGPAAARLEAWLAQQDPATLSSATLINNAAMVSELAPLGRVAADDLSRTLRVGLEAPTLLSSVFLRATAGWALPRKLLLISSGLGRFAMAGSASYCAVKAGMDHLARAVALEEAGRPDGARIVSLAPGVIDTDMQGQLRAADPALFADRTRFVGLKSEGKLDSPAQAAAKVLRYLARSDFGANPVADVRDA